MPDYGTALARLGGEAARTRAGGLHRVGAYAQIERKRDMPIEWEAGDVKRSRAAGVKQGRGAGRKADGTLDRRLKANRAGRGGEAGGGDGEGDGRSGGGGGGGEGIGPDQQPPPPPVAGEKRRRVATSRWQARALDEFDSAVRVARRDGVT